MRASLSARQRVREELTREIKEAARRQLAREGAASLSLRAVARELGMASSALYRYFPSRDDLLTALIVDAYNDLGTAAEAADAACPREEFEKRWMEACQAARWWALEHPHEYALIYGSPVPGYDAPDERTVGPATRVAAVLAGIVTDAGHANRIQETLPAPPLPPTVAANATRLRESLLSEVPETTVVLALMAWTYLFGAITFELFGHWENSVGDYTEFFDYSVEYMRRVVGVPSSL